MKYNKNISISVIKSMFVVIFGVMIMTPLFSWVLNTYPKAVIVTGFNRPESELVLVL